MAREHHLWGALIGASISAAAFVHAADAGAPVTVCSATIPNTAGHCANVTGGAVSISPAPTADPAAAVAENAAPAAASSYVLKASGGNAYSVAAVNFTGTAGFLVVLDASSVPADGPIAPIGCAPLAGSSPASLAWGQGSPPVHFTNGLVAVLTSGATCYTKTTGAITGFISGQAQ